MIKIEQKEKCIVASLFGRLDIQEYESFIEQLRPLCILGKNIVLDFSELVYISSAGLQGVAIIGKELIRNGCSLSLYQFKGMVKEVLNVTGFTNIFKEVYKI